MMPAVPERLVWLVPAAVVAAGLARPRAALVALAASLPLFGASRGGPYLGALDAACLAAILLSLRGRRPERTGLDLAVLAFAAVGLASFVPLAWRPPSWEPRVLAALPHALANASTASGLFAWRAALDLLLGAGLYLAARRAFAGRSLRPSASASPGAWGRSSSSASPSTRGRSTSETGARSRPKGGSTLSSPTPAGSGSTW
jgi:hypothetical protein